MNTLYLFINLEQDNSRKFHMMRSADRLDLTFHRVPAFDLKRLGREPTQHKAVPSYANERWMLRPFEIAVFESHRRAWLTFLQSDAKLCVVMEDDLLFAAGFRNAVEALEKTVDQFDIVKINHSVQSRLMGRPFAICDEYQLRRILENVSDAGCYLLTRRSAEALIQGSIGYASHLDDYVFSPDRNLRTMQLFQPMCSQMIHINPLGKDAALTISTRLLQTDQIQKGPRTFRILKELRRILKRTVWRMRAIAAQGERVDMHALLDDFAPISTDKVTAQR